MHALKACKWPCPAAKTPDDDLCQGWWPASMAMLAHEDVFLRRGEKWIQSTLLSLPQVHSMGRTGETMARAPLDKESCPSG